MGLKEKITELVNKSIAEYPHLFLVDIENFGTKGFRYLVDGDEGVGIHDCSSISRSVIKAIDETDLSEEAFDFEVSSPGADRPLLLKRQYPKHIGRSLEVFTNNGEIVSGILSEANENEIIIEVKAAKKLKKDQSPELKNIPFEEISKSLINISFK